MKEFFLCIDNYPINIRNTSSSYVTGANIVVDGGLDRLVGDNSLNKINNLTRKM